MAVEGTEPPGARGLSQPVRLRGLRFWRLASANLPNNVFSQQIARTPNALLQIVYKFPLAPLGKQLANVSEVAIPSFRPWTDF